ncbi:PDZ domain-containing protein [Deinococcus sp. HMF7620]|uniref:PDZ domain-containing protein n=1 Tax=Deinococcus arboris TaxID=2682977 RepID=A0A7C9I0W9_9DEIO|nr:MULTISPECIES: S41 family peptidase [Deinococcus]MBZ9752037.1 PDZ domain-containing protein [Deinococcus betulae]MVN88215.1 PDZ domain-containing protein [Deinococcus arboris]
MTSPVPRRPAPRVFARPSLPFLRAARLGGLTALLLGASLAPGAAAQGVVSPAQDIFNKVNLLIQNQYGGLSTVDRAALTEEYQLRLSAVCAPAPDTCEEAKAYPVLSAELTALGDDHSFFNTPEDYREFVASATGGNRLQFGVKLARLDGQNRVVTEVVPGSAAAEAGLQRGDVLQTIGGQPYVYEDLRRAREEGRTIVLGVTRRAETLTLTLTARESSTRDLPRLSFVPGAGAGEVAVLRIPTFLSGGGIAQGVHDLVGQAQARGATGLIVDLRGNGGGSLAECDSAVSAFVPSLTRVARSPDGNDRTVVSRGTRIEDGMVRGSVRNPNLWSGPVAVLVDEGSASCSEFFAFEIQYAGRGPIIGEETAGVGNTATRVWPVGEGAVQLTILNYAKPDGTPYPQRVQPDQARAEGEPEIRQLTQGVDTLLQAGVQALQSAPALSLDPFRSQP